jgi:hypothetical protein
MIRPEWLTKPDFLKLELKLPAYLKPGPAKAGFLKPALALPGIAVALTVLLAAELLLPGPGADTGRVALGIPAATPDQGADADISQWGDTILARPLFSANRRPADQPSASTDNTLPRLSAIIIIGGTRTAIFAAPGQKAQLVHQGGTINGYQLQNIAPDKVRLLGPDGAVTLRLQLIHTAPATAANANNSS